MKTLGWALLALVLLSGTVEAVTGVSKMRTVEHLLYNCRDFSKLEDLSDVVRMAKATYCTGYVEGAYEALAISRAARKDFGGRPLICPRASDTRQQSQIFVDWAEKHPENGDQLAIIGVIAAWMEAWPCSKK